MAKNKNNQDADLEKYHDLSGLSVKEMNFGLWLSERRRLITKIIIICLIVISAFFFIYSSYNYIVYFLTGQSDGSASYSSVVSPRNLVSDLEISSVTVLASGDRSDLTVAIKNPNEKFRADFNYCFESAGKEIACGKSFILPQSEKMVLALGQDLSQYPGQITFKTADLFWARINNHKISDWETYSNDRLNFIFENIAFANSASSGLSEKININTLDFTVKNDSPYGYYQVPLNIALFSGANLVGVNRYLATDFKAGETRSIKISWTGNIARVNRTEIKPDLDIMDDAAYLKYEGEAVK